MALITRILFSILLVLGAASAGLPLHLLDSLAPGSRLGISIRSVKQNKPVLEVNAGDYFTPASTLKTLTTASAVSLLPIQYEPQTHLFLEGSLSGKTFSGDLRIRGEGDPNISGRYYPHALYMLEVMADSMKAFGIDTLQGKIVMDTSYFRGARKPPQWNTRHFNSWYAAEISPLSFNDNCVLIKLKPGEKAGDTALITLEPDVPYVQIKNQLLTSEGKRRKWIYEADPDKAVFSFSGEIGVGVDSASLVLPVRNPAAYFQAAFQKVLADKGITYLPNASIPRGILIKSFSFSAAPLLSILDEINQRSQNLHAEILFRNLGQIIENEGSAAGGVRAEKRFLDLAGISDSNFQRVDGSGLSDLNKVKPGSVSELLAFMARSPQKNFYIESFASPMIGTGSKRMTALKAPGQTRFKTGFINEAHGLAGYVYTLTGDTLTVALYLNDTGKNPDAKCRAFLDTVWTTIVDDMNNDYGSLLEMKRLWLDARYITDFDARTAHFSKEFLGRPYLLGPLGEGEFGGKPLVYTDSFDCVTYMEHVLAMAYAVHEDSLFNQLQQLRYTGGEIDYLTRKHYFVEDWMRDARFSKMVPMEGDTTIVRELPKKQFFAKAGLTYEKDNPKTEIRYLPYEKVLKWAKQPWEKPAQVYGIAFVGKSEAIDVTHTAFLILEPGKKPLMRHASSLQNKVADQLFDSYLESRKGKTPGVVFFEFVKPVL
ncbi:MAG: D-alanyl-D-alanine carboxypeptidase/D-alanyl-D-alanine-endopeptidase [Fibrobacter sp.]|jgi:D-alanyl-D-alanine carboxypeptidase/D-alanyl-D-alanine-endopeptidase (penicillin-binding protein 4)|nr:D-alanyl-D-alanine carboxypeptidase/D-alanyl-D-alanine-endopeptidase [Fibrobacter sp.]